MFFRLVPAVICSALLHFRLFTAFFLKKSSDKKGPYYTLVQQGPVYVRTFCLKKILTKKALTANSSKGLIKSNCKIKTGNDNRSPQISTSNGARTVKSPRQRIQSYKNDLIISLNKNFILTTWHNTTPGNIIVHLKIFAIGDLGITFTKSYYLY